MKIAFYTYNVDVRGSCVALYDYAHHNEILLKNKSVIIVPRDSKYTDSIALHKFTKRFEVRFTDDLESSVADCDILYVIKYGKNDGVYSKNIKTVIHCVFDLSEPHGDVYAAVSDTLAQKWNTPYFVPHMIGLKPSTTLDNMRKDLGIPETSVVFGRHGGMDTFDLEMAKNAIRRIVQDKPSVHFIFVNTPVFFDHPNIHHLDKICDLDEKNRFICSCDAMIHAQSLGETFGLSIGEFSVNNKPVISYNGVVWNDHHKTVLGKKGVSYSTEDECYNTLINFKKPNPYDNIDYNCYREYSPEKVMEIFKKVFLE